jgi:TPP-dependent pyruvate/acetoin dehydrogenase alpha subunit
MYRVMLLIRRVEEEIARIYPTDVIKSPVHLSIGQEAASVAVCDALRPDDAVFGTYRGHALYLAKGGDLRAMIAELYGKVTGCARGKGGSMHLIDTQAGMYGTSAVVATTIPHAVGYAKAIRVMGDDRVVACFFGDGAVEEGAFHESMNFAALHRLPVLFVCENNFYAIHTRIEARQASTDLMRRARSYGMPADCVEDGDPIRIRELAGRWLARMRARKSGPAFLECRAYRWKEHVGPSEDFHVGYRSEQEAQEWMQRDPVRVLGSKLDSETREQVAADVDRAVLDAFGFAASSPYPPDSDLWDHVYGDSE